MKQGHYPNFAGLRPRPSGRTERGRDPHCEALPGALHPRGSGGGANRLLTSGQSQIDNLIAIGCRGRFMVRFPLARQTSWRVGGCADYAYAPIDAEDLALFLQQVPTEQPLTWLGLGSNVLIRDGGIAGIVILPRYHLTTLAMQKDGLIRACAGVSCAKLAKYTVRHHQIGGAFFAGIPGTVGGALAMNAGAFGGETWQHVVSVETIDRLGVVRQQSASDFQIAYRRVEGLGKDRWFLAGYFRFETAVSTNAHTREHNVRALLRIRNEKQPIGARSCGSVFKNPAGDHAARLIEASGLKGYQIGGACVSNKHANFILNQAQASAADIETLIEHIEQTVWAKQGVRLAREVHVLGRVLRPARNVDE